MTDLGFEPCKADPDVWLQRASKPDGLHSCKHVLFHVNDALAVCFLDPKTVLLKMDEHFLMKPDSIAVPNVCLGAKLFKAKLPNGPEAWAMSSSKCAQEGVKNVKGWL
jgi:hypothetical protein